MAITLAGTCQRPLTSCAHRLRRAIRNRGTSDVLCRTTSPREAGSDPHLLRTSGLPRWPAFTRSCERAASSRTRALSRQARWARRRVRTNGHRTNQDAFRRVALNLAIQGGEAACVVHVRWLLLAPSHPLRARSASSKDGGSLRAIPHPGSSQVALRVTWLARKMRLPDFCNRLSTRAPCLLPDSRSPAFQPGCLAAPSPSGRARPSVPPSSARRFQPRTFQSTDERSGGASLDGESPASALFRSLVTASRSRGSLRPFDSSVARTGVGPDRGLLRRTLPNPWRCRPRRARNTTSDALCRGHRVRSRSLDRSHAGDRQAPSPPPVPSRTVASPEPGRLPSTSVLSSASTGALPRSYP